MYIHVYTYICIHLHVQYAHLYVVYSILWNSTHKKIDYRGIFLKTKVLGNYRLSGMKNQLNWPHKPDSKRKKPAVM